MYSETTLNFVEPIFQDFGVQSKNLLYVNPVNNLNSHKKSPLNIDWSLPEATVFIIIQIRNLKPTIYEPEAL